MIKSSPFWSTYDYHRNQVESELGENRNFDIVIIGSGITGVSVAYWLKELGYAGLHE
jgi:glycerol-3-phosphate dehydrogenase